MSGFATYTKKRRAHVSSFDGVAKLQRYRVVRIDGAVLGGSPDKATAERLSRVINVGQRRDYSVVLGGAR
ncbi:MAG: hypothetical protein JNM17_04010 [Archangium sp.]|nr:hypothetical protein [Archangium sp.]